jgi:tetratricopeptide (TPR) repeat protein
MLLKLLDTREAVEVGEALAEEFVSRTAPSGSSGESRIEKPTPLNARALQSSLNKFLQHVDREVRPLRLHFFRKARLANSFKWRLLEKGVNREIADAVTGALVMRLSAGGAEESGPPSAGRSARSKAQALVSKGDEYMRRNAPAEAEECYRELLSLDPRHALASNNLGAALCQLGRYKEAERWFRRAIQNRAGWADAHCNLGTVLRMTGRLAESETSLRRALKLRPAYPDAQVSLATTLTQLGRLRDAGDLLERVLRASPRNAEALVRAGRIAALEGRFVEAETLLRRGLEVDPRSSVAWLTLAGLRTMRPDDRALLKGAEVAVAGGLAPCEEATVLYAMGKYYDDVGDFARAFRSYRRANELHRLAAEPYDREGRRRCVDNLIRVYTRETLSRLNAGASESTRPVFVVGMMRSGTSLVEQIIASHPVAKGAGELDFWARAVHKHEDVLRSGPPDERLTSKLAVAYLRDLAARFADATRVVDKSTFNSDYLGIIHLAFPNARMIYLRRDPIDTCLSCYFQQFLPTMSFTMDLSDLAHYYREHRRLVAHWRSVLPRETLLEVPYEELIADQEKWTRRILDFIGLEWDERCLNFHETERPVQTASYWQVRQKIYHSSVGRWRHYEKFIGPLLELRDRGDR